MNDRNENRPGYKETKVGWIPEEWNDSKLGTHMKCFSGGTPQSGTREYYNGNIPWIKSGELNQKNIYETNEFITEEAVKKSSAKFVESGTLLYALYGATAGVPGYTQIRATINQAVLAIMPSQKLNKHFCYFWFYSEKDRLIARYTQGGQPNLSGTIVKSFHIPLPPLPEQEAIAEFLGCWDEGLESLEKLIEAKKLRKKGLMQKLLTGEKRLPGFSNDWKEVQLGDVFDRVTKKNKAGCSNNLTISGPLGLINQEEYFKKRIASQDNSGYYLIKNGDFAYNKSYCNGYPLGAIKRLDRYNEGVVSTLYICFALIDGAADSNFMTQYFENGELDHEIYRVAQEGARNHGLLNITATDFFNGQIAIPPTLEEQQAIAEVLETADEEIQLLEAERDALSKQKKGLMQKLLTGEIRCPDFRRSKDSSLTAKNRSKEPGT